LISSPIIYIPHNLPSRVSSKCRVIESALLASHIMHLKWVRFKRYRYRHRCSCRYRYKSALATCCHTHSICGSPVTVVSKWSKIVYQLPHWFPPDWPLCI